jgi:hypothetical protein
MAMKNHHTLVDGYLILALYPASMLLCYCLEAIGWN